MGRANGGPLAGGMELAQMLSAFAGQPFTVAVSKSGAARQDKVMQIQGPVVIAGRENVA